MKNYSKILDIIQQIYKWIIIFAMAVFSVVIIASVFWRYFLRNPFTWAEQLSRFLFVWTIMLGIPVYYRVGLATYLDLLVEKFPTTLKQIVSIAMDILVGFFAVYYGYSGLLYVTQSGSSIFQGLGIPSGCVYASELACSAYLILCVIESVIKKISRFGNTNLLGGGGDV